MLVGIGFFYFVEVVLVCCGLCKVDRFFKERICL